MKRIPSKRWSGATGRVAISVGLLFTTAQCAPEPGVAEAPEILIQGLDYTYRIPDSIPSGPVRIAFENRGDVPHELTLGRLLPGVTLADMMEAYRTGSRPREEIVDPGGGILVAPAGQAARARLAVTLEPGRTYVIYCRLRDGEEEPPHLTLGMVRAFTVS